MYMYTVHVYMYSIVTQRLNNILISPQFTISGIFFTFRFVSYYDVKQI